MKKLLFFLLCSVVLFSACSKADSNQLNVPKTEYTVDPNGGLVEVFFQANDNLEIEFETAQEWVSLPQTKSLNLNMLVFQCKPNDTFAQRDIRIKLFVANSNLQQYINIKQLANTDTLPKIKSFVFQAQKNQSLLQSDIVAQISGDTIITAHIPHIIQSRNLTPTIEFEGKSIYPIDPPNFDKKVIYTVEATNGQKKDYTVYLTSSTGLPMVFIQTKDGAPIESKDNYLEGVVKLDGNGIVESMESDMKIKGRGNSTWGFPKKPYKIKFDKKVSMAGFPADKEWVLLANYFDKSFIRNSLAFEISSILGTDWSNRNCHVDLYINQEYQGNYLLCEQIKIAENRVNVVELTDADIQEPQISGGYLLELDSYFDEDLKFRSAVKNLPVMIKEPDLNATQLAWIENHFNEAENAMYSENFADPINGYAKYIDVQSFIKWWLTYELTANWEPSHPKSCYMTKDRGQKFKMGPAWDFDYGTYRAHNVFCNKQSLWFDRLFQDPNFVKQLKEFWNSKKEVLSEIQLSINKYSSQLKYSEKQDTEKWGRYINYPDNFPIGSYQNEIQNLKIYFEKRLKWLDVEINKL